MAVATSEMEEGVGESSSPARLVNAEAGPAEPLPVGSGEDIRQDVFERLLADGNEEAVSNPVEFRALINAHFNRLPPSYQLDLNMEKAEEVWIHQKVLALAEDPKRRPAFHVRFLKVEDPFLDLTNDSDEADEGSSFPDALSARHVVQRTPVHEIIFSTTDKPKLLSQLSAVLSDIGLNIREAHVFSTTDGYSLDVFVVDGWPTEDTEALYKTLEAALIRNEGSWSGSSSHSSASERTLPAGVTKLGEWEIDKRSLIKGEKIASGSCGDLYRGSYFGEDVAIKFLRTEHLSENLRSEFYQEISILREVQHPNVVRFIGACTKPPEYCIVTEYMSGGNLYELLHKHNGNLELSVLLKYALDVCRGMEYLHQKNIVHRDLKTANLLIDRDHVIKVADFGVARIQDQGSIMTAETGTYRWMAPEVINHQQYDGKADVFSFAIVLWELVTAKIPYDSMTPLQAALGVRQGMRPTLPENVHPKFSSLITRCWETVPAKRPSFAEIILELEELQMEIQSNMERVDHKTSLEMNSAE